MNTTVGAAGNLWQRLYTDHSEAYERMVQAEDYQRNLLTAINDIHPLQNTQVVEFGAGTGRITRQLLPVVKNLWAFDLTPAMINIAATKLKQTGWSNMSGCFLYVSFLGR